MSNKEVFVIIAAFNEAEVIGSVLKELLPSGYSIVIADDASTDNTAAIIKSFPVFYLRHKINLGQGAALQTGINFALQKGAEYFVTFDADGQHDPGDILPMLGDLIAEKSDIVFGSRFLGDNKTKISFGRKAVLSFARYLNFLLTGILLSDAHNGLRAFNKKAAITIHIHENRMAHATELLMITQQKKLRYKEIPVNIRYTAYSVKKGQKNFHSFKVLQDILLHKIFK